MKSKEVIKPLQIGKPTEYADKLGEYYSNSIKSGSKKQKGQFFTPREIAYFMSRMLCDSEKEEVKILDPGCGTGILSCALVEKLLQNNGTVESIFITAYETDYDLISILNESLSYLKEWCSTKDVILNYRIHTCDFVLENKDSLAALPSIKEEFDYIISNPPYFKLNKIDPRAKVAEYVTNGQPNIYAVFLAVSVRLLAQKGELVFIIPRSFASGNYFSMFRKFLYRELTINRIHLFDSRKEAFSKDDVLQEVLILKAERKSTENVDNIIISNSKGIQNIENAETREYPLREIVNFESKEKILHIPSNDLEERIIKLFRGWGGSLHRYHLQISTGPVVSFRASEFIFAEKQEDATALYWLHNVKKMRVEWPLEFNNKGQFIKVSELTKSILLANKNYVLLRRFSSKDDNSRLISAPLFISQLDLDSIGIENKLNYIYRVKGNLEREEVMGLSAILNSTLFDIYFGTFNGNVNVSATEIREMPLPDIKVIEEIGSELILMNDFSQMNIDKLVNEKLFFEELIEI